MRFENTKCDGCGHMFEKDDDVVVCPECGTPQHRSCYELNGGCVNAAKHESGFVWTESEAKTAKAEIPESEMLRCPNCGALNSPKSEKCSHCGQNFTVFGVNLAEEQKAHEQNEPFTQATGFDSTDEIPTLDHVVEARIHALAPGILPEQRKEQVCGHGIGETISFIGNNAAAYIKKFRKMEREKKHTFNWGAFFFTPVWFFWRRLYKVGIVYMAIMISLTMLMTYPSQNYLAVIDSIASSSSSVITDAQMETLMSAAVPIFIFGIIEFALHLIAGFTADKMYWKYCGRTLNDVRRMKQSEDNVTVLNFYLKHSSTGMFTTLIAAVAYYFLPSFLMSLFMQM